MESLALETSVAARIEAAGRGQVRRVTMLGSRANGTAKAGSDLDIVVMMEPDGGDGAWGKRRLRAERRRIMGTMGTLPVRLDCWIRTVDQYFEGKDVVGGFEYLAEHEGVVLFARPISRQPMIRRTRDQVRRSNIRAWLHDADVSLRKAASVSHLDRVMGEPGNRDLSYYGWRSIQRCMTAILVSYQIPSAKAEAVDAYLEKIRGVDPSIGNWLTCRLSGDADAIPLAHEVLHEIVAWALEDPGNRLYLAALSERIRAPLIHFR